MLCKGSPLDFKKSLSCTKQAACSSLRQLRVSRHGAVVTLRSDLSKGYAKVSLRTWNTLFMLSFCFEIDVWLYGPIVVASYDEIL